MMKKKNTILISIAALGLISFLTILIFVLKADAAPLAIDLKIQKAIIGLRSDALNPVMWITYLSNPSFIIALIAVLVLFKPIRVKVGVPVGISEAVAYGIYETIKHIIARARPDAALHLVSQGGYSFPSGHSVTSVVVYGIFIYLIRRYCKNEKLKNILTAVFTLLIIVIGLSRIYVGVHWPSDVLAGWSLGISILMMSIFVQEKRREKGEK